MSTCNRLDLQTLGSQLVIVLENLPDHCFEGMSHDGLVGNMVARCGCSRQAPHRERNKFLVSWCIAFLACG